MSRTMGPHGSRSGFSLVELMVVVSIIGVLAALATPILSTYRDQAKMAAAKSYGIQILNSMAAVAAASPDNRYPPVETCDDVAAVANEGGFAFTGEIRSQICNGGGDLIVHCACMRDDGVWVEYDCILDQRPAGCGHSLPPSPPSPGFDDPILYFHLLQIQDQRYLKVSTVSGVSVLERVPESGEVIN